MDLGYSGLQSENKMNIPPHTLVGYGTLNSLKYGGVMVTDVRGPNVRWQWGATSQ